MATVDVLGLQAVPGLHRRPTLDDIGKSGRLYNTLPDDEDQPEVSDKIIADLKAMIRSYGVQEKFGFHLVHGHLKMAQGMAMVGKPMEKLPAVWTRPIKADHLNLEALHGYVFVLCADNTFHPYEYRQGSPPTMTANDNAFIAEALDFLQLHGITGIIGIQLLEQSTLGKPLKEFVLSDTNGTIMIPADAAKPTDTYRITGWNALGGITDLKENGETHSQTDDGKHKVITRGKELPDMDNSLAAEDIIVEALRDSGVID